MKNVFTTKEAAAILGVTDSRVRQLVLSGDIDHYYFGRSLVITQTGIEQVRARREKRTQSFKSAVKRAA